MAAGTRAAASDFGKAAAVATALAVQMMARLGSCFARFGMGSSETPDDAELAVAAAFAAAGALTCLEVDLP